MNHLLDAVENAIRTSNWYAALMVALVLPDIAGWIENPNSKSRSRYIAWVERYLAPRYTCQIGPDQMTHKFLSGDDCYALRCAILHEGRDDTSNQQAHVALERFLFISPQNGSIVHMNQRNTRLQLQVDIFCRDICEAVTEWLESISTDSERQARLTELAVIQTTGINQI